MKPININNITIDKGTQSRAEISEETVADYAEAMTAGDVFPAIVVFYDGIDYYLGDGFHRLHAAKRLGKASVQADIRTGTLRDAILFSLSANNDHGLRRSNADKRNCVMTMLEDFEWGEWPITQIAKRCAVSPQLVSAVKAEMAGGTKVSSHVPAPKVKKKLKNVIEEQKPAEESFVQDEAVQELVAENQRLSDRLAIGTMEGSEEEKNVASETIGSLREQVRLLEIENQSLKISRDTFQRENAELKKTVSSLQRQIKKQD